MRMIKGRKILLLKLTRMGDILESQPLLRDIRQCEPQSQITMVVNETFREAAYLLPEVDHILSFPLFEYVQDIRDAKEDLVDLYHRLESFADSLATEKYDLVLNLTNSRLSGMLMGFIQARQMRGLWFDEHGNREVVGALIRYFGANEGMRRFSPFNLSDFMRCLYGAMGQTAPSTLRISPEADQTAAELLHTAEDQSSLLVGIQLGASEACKRWRLDDFATMASHLIQGRGPHAEPIRVVLVGSKDERPLARYFEELFQGEGHQLINLVGRTSLPELAAVVSKFHLLISNDTGTMHLASALNVPVLNLSLGSAFFRETGPHGAGHLILEPRIECRPCDFNSTCSHHNCKRLIQPMAVAALAQSMLHNGEGLDAILATLSSCDVYETVFDQDGLLDYARRTPRPLLFDEVLLHVFRISLLQSELGGDFTARLEDGMARLLRDGSSLAEGVERELMGSLERFQRLETLAAYGMTCIEKAMESVYQDDRAMIERHMAEATQRDFEILTLGRDYADARLLMRSYVLNKEAVRSAHVELILRGDLACFGSLQTVAAWSRRALERALQVLSTHNQGPLPRDLTENETIAV